MVYLVHQVTKVTKVTKATQLIKQMIGKENKLNVDPKPNLRDNSYKLNKQLNIN